MADAEAAKTCSTLVEAFDSSRLRGETRETPVTAVDESAPGASLRNRGNDAMTRGDFTLAHGFYTEALEAAQTTTRICERWYFVIERWRRTSSASTTRPCVTRSVRRSSRRDGVK